MKIIDAVWEKRNLGKSCKEIYIEKNDIMQDVFQGLCNIKEEFQELFVPVECSEYLLRLPQYGFFYIESNFDLVKKCNADTPFPPMYNEILKAVSSRLIGQEEIDDFLQRLRTEYFFDKDKISIDYHFPEAASKNRNYLRLKDYIAEGRKIDIYEVVRGEQAIGYFILDIKEKGHIEVHLSGLYPEFRGSKFGTCVMGEETRQAVKQGAKLITTGVSLNNFACLRVYQSLGYEIKRATNIFVKHGG